MRRQMRVVLISAELPGLSLSKLVAYLDRVYEQTSAINLWVVSI